MGAKYSHVLEVQENCVAVDTIIRKGPP
jgi:hypothetical protein